MKRKLFLLFVCLFGALGGVNAYTTENLEDAGWKQVTTTAALSTAVTAGNYFVLIDAGTSNYAVTHSLYLGNRMYYQATANPCDDAGELWNLEATATANQYNLRNVSSRRYPGGWDNYMFKTTSETNADCPTTFEVNNSKWTLKRSSSGAEVGPWNNDKAVNTDGNSEPKVAGYENVAANKAAGQPGFYIYTMSVSDFLALSTSGAGSETPKNVSYFIKNPSFENGEADAWTLAESESSDRAVRDAKDNTYIMTNSHGYRLFNTWSWGQPITQEITEIPNGRYNIQAVVANSSNGDPAKVYLLANNEHKGITCDTDGGKGVEGSISTLVTNHSLTIGAVGSNNDAERSYIENGLWWFKVDNFRLYYLGNAVSYYSPDTFESGSSATAGTWYKFAVPIYGSYKITSTIGATIYYTQNESDDADKTLSMELEASESVSMKLTAGEFYFKSNADNTLSIVPSDIATASQELPNSAVTANDWYRFTTGSSSDAYVLSSTGNATVTYTTVGTKTIVDEITDTWTLTNKLNVVLAPSTTYYIKSNAAVTLTKTETSVSSSFVTGWTKVTSCEQLANNPKDYFFAIFSANNTGLYLINRNEANNEKLRYVTAGDPLRNGASLFEVENFDGDFVLKSAVNGKYFENRPVDGQDRPGIGEQDGPWNYHADLTERDENCRTTLSFYDGVCTIQDKNAHNGNRYIGLWYVDHDYANNEILAGNKSEAEKASFIIYRIPKDDCDFNNLIQNADFSSTTGWTEYKSAEYVNMGNGLIGTFIPTGSTAATVDETHLATEYCIGFQARWNTNYTAYQQTTATLPSGHYVLSYDVEDVNSSSTKINYDNLFFVQIGDDKYIDESTEWMNAGKSSWTTHSIAFDLDEASAVKISLGYGNKEDKNTTPIIYVSHLKLEYSSYADDGDYAELNAAISAAESNTLGFETDEYAPYNNADALTKLEAAKAIDQDESNLKSDVEKATSDLTGATWTANAEEVDAICNGSFTGIARGTQDNVVPGWDGGVFRKLVTTDDYAALSASKEGRAMFSHEKTYVYGRQTGYTMPLKRNTKYALSFKAAGWENGNIATVSAVIKKPDGNTLKTLNITPTKRINEAESLVSGSIDFTVETSGNYTLEVTVPASTLAVITDFSVERLGIPVLMQVSGVAKMGTFCAPFNVKIPSGVKAYTLSDGTSDDWVHMNEVEGTTIAAGTPVLLTSDTKVEQEFVGQMTVLEPNNDGLLKGVFEKTEVAPDANNYILQYQDSKCAFYIVSDADIYIGKNRCYLHVAKTSARIAIDREEDGFTGINEVKSSEVEAKMMKDGKYLVKGRIIVVKNGKVYGTNGQILN